MTATPTKLRDGMALEDARHIDACQDNPLAQTVEAAITAITAVREEWARVGTYWAGKQHRKMDPVLDELRTMLRRSSDQLAKYKTAEQLRDDVAYDDAREVALPSLVPDVPREFVRWEFRVVGQ